MKIILPKKHLIINIKPPTKLNHTKKYTVFGNYVCSVTDSLIHILMFEYLLAVWVYICVVQNSGGRWYGRFSVLR